MGDKKVLEPVITGNGIKSSISFNADSPSITDGMEYPAPGEVLVVKIGADGKEVKDSAFYIGEYTFTQRFADKPEFIVKKKG